MLLHPVFWSTLTTVGAIDIDPSNSTSIEAALTTVIEGAFPVYSPWVRNESGATVGTFQEPYYWWEAGVAWSQMIDRWAYTGNDTYNDMAREAMVAQSGKTHNYMTQNQTTVEGNDDQAFWGIATMNAAEKNFTNPEGDVPPWLYFAQATFNSMAGRWDTGSCNGGLRWQIYPWNAGYDYKNMVANGALFHLAARLTRFTNNETYIEWAEKVWQWAEGVELLQVSGSGNDSYVQVFDGAHITDNCSDRQSAEWTYDYGMMLSGCAYLYNYTQNSTWRDRADAIWNRATALFSTNGADWMPGDYVMYEPGCMTKDESTVRCSNDQRCFKGIALSMFGYAIQVYSDLRERVWDYIEYSAQAAAWSCTGGTDGHTCGLSWLHEGWDGYSGVGEQLCAMGAFNALLIDDFKGPYTAADLPEVYHATTNGSVGGGNGSTSEGGGQVFGWGGTAGLENDTTTPDSVAVETSDKGGAGFLTAIVIIFIVGGSAWLVL